MRKLHQCYTILNISASYYHVKFHKPGKKKKRTAEDFRSENISNFSAVAPHIVVQPLDNILYSWTIKNFKIENLNA